MIPQQPPPKTNGASTVKPCGGSHRTNRHAIGPERKCFRVKSRADLCQIARRATLIHHSDRGSQYVAIKYAQRLTDAGVEPSVGSGGDSYDNALAETINGLYKTEVIRRRGPWRTLETVEFATLEWVDWFNNRRLLEPIGNIPPAEAEARYYAQIEDVAMAA